FQQLLQLYQRAETNFQKLPPTSKSPLPQNTSANLGDVATAENRMAGCAILQAVLAEQLADCVLTVCVLNKAVFAEIITVLNLNSADPTSTVRDPKSSEARVANLGKPH